jgi:pimeloyl-ACP methyl ester carboxylesterase
MSETVRRFTFRTDDGFRLAAQQHEPPLRVSDVPVVLQHGFAADSQSNWTTPGIVEHLLVSGRQVVLLDARGHGMSDKPHSPEHYGHAVMAQDVRTLIDEVLTDSGVDHVDFVGYSMGGWIGMHVLVTEPRIRRAVIAGVGAPAGERTIERDPRDPVDRVGIAAAIDQFLSDSTYRPSDKGIRDFLRFAFASGGDLAAYAALMRSADPSPVGVADIRVPVLVLAGELDELAATAPELANQIPGAQMKWCPGTHLSVIAEPSFASAITTFLGDETR